MMPTLPAMPVTSLRQIIRIFAVLLLTAALTACNRDASTPSVDSTPPPVQSPAVSAIEDEQLTANVQALTVNYLEQIDQDFEDTRQALATLQTAINELLLAPTAAALEAARDTWLNAMSAYELTALHRYFASRLLTGAASDQWFQLQYQINQWPVLPGYIDYVQDYAESGIVNDITVPLTPQSLREQNGTFEIAEATLGFHVLEFLLWGSNENEANPRPVTDFVAVTGLNSEQVESGLTLEQLPNNRRRELSSLVTQLLVEDFDSLQSLWGVYSETVRGQILAMPASQILPILMGSMTEMLNEELLVRSLYPLLNGDYSDSIQSPYSHSTQNAVSAQLSGLERMLLENTTGDGITLDSLISRLSEDFADFFYENFDASKECLVVLYSNLEAPADSPAALRAEFDIVECINLVTNMIDHLGQIAPLPR